MSSRDFDLGNFELRSKNSSLSLALSSSMTLALPNGYDEKAVAKDIAKASSSGKLWIAKASSCRLDFGGAASGNQLIQRALEGLYGHDEAIRSAAECPVWADLGLELRMILDAQDSQPEGNSGLTFYLGHKNMSSEILAPPGIPCARFESLRCSFLFSQREKQGKSGPKERRRPVLSHSYETRARTWKPRSSAARETANGWGEDDLTAEASAQPIRAAEDTIHRTTLGKEDSKLLIEAALQRLLGVKRATTGIQTITGMSFPALTAIAPAVWNLRYLQSWKEHVDLAPSVAASLTQLLRAKDSRLQQKMVTLGGSAEYAEPRNTHEEFRIDAQATIHRRLWLLCQRQVRAEPLTKDRGRMSSDSLREGVEGGVKTTCQAAPETPGNEGLLPVTDESMDQVDIHGHAEFPQPWQPHANDPELPWQLPTELDPYVFDQATPTQEYDREIHDTPMAMNCAAGPSIEDVDRNLRFSHSPFAHEGMAYTSWSAEPGFVSYHESDQEACLEAPMSRVDHFENSEYRESHYRVGLEFGLHAL